MDCTVVSLSPYCLFNECIWNLRQQFLPYNATVARYMLWPSVRLSVCHKLGAPNSHGIGSLDNIL